MDVSSVSREMVQQILSGRYGASGERFLSVRALSEATGCAYVTATRVMARLREEHMVTMVGHEHYVTTGLCALSTPLGARLKETRRPYYGMLVNQIDNHCFVLLIAHVQEALRARGEELIVMVNSSDMELERRQLRMMLEMGVMGIFFFPHSRFKNQAIYERFPLPVVAMGRQLRGFGRSAVTVDNLTVGKLAALHLKARGYEDFLYIGPEQHAYMIDERYMGFATRLNELGIALPREKALFVDAADVEKSIQQFGERISGLRVPTGVFCYHDNIAVALLKLCVARGIPVPERVGIVGCDNLPVTTATTPMLTTVNYPYGRITQLAVETMLAERTEGVCRGRRIEAPPQLLPRRSTERDGALR